MPRKRHLEEAGASTITKTSPDDDTPVAGGATHLLDGMPPANAAPTQQPVMLNGDRLAKKAGPPRIPADSLAAVSARLGGGIFERNKRFEWAKAPNNHHYEFTRYYPYQRVIIDVWRASNATTTKDSAKKRACVDAENVRRTERGEKPIGLLAWVQGAFIEDELFEKALAGETCDLIERSVNGIQV